MRRPQQPMLLQKCEVLPGVAYSQHLLHNYPHDFLPQCRCARRLGLCRGRAAAPPGPPSRPRRRLGGRGLLGRPAARRPLSRAAGGLRRAHLLLGRRGPREGRRRAVLRPAPWPGGRARPACPGRGRARGRPVGRLPAARSGGVGDLVRRRRPPGAPGRGAARRGGLRPARAPPRGARGARLVAVPGCYPTASILAIAPLLDARPGRRRRAGDRRQERRVGRRPHAGPGDPPARGRRGRARPTRSAAATATRRRSSRSWAAPPGRRSPCLFTPHLVPMSRGILACCLRDADRSDAAGRRLPRRAGRRLRRRAVRRRAARPASCPTPPTSAARTAPRHGGLRRRARAACWRWRRSTTWSRAPPARPCSA